MITFFAQFFYLSYLVPTLLRVMAAMYFFYIANFLWSERSHLERLHVPMIGKMSLWMIQLSCLATAGVGVFLFFGYQTQWAALLGSLILLKHLYATRNYASSLPFARSTYLLLLVICLTFLITGAGLFAVDQAPL